MQEASEAKGATNQAELVSKYSLLTVQPPTYVPMFLLAKVSQS